MLHRATAPIVLACALLIACAGASFAIFPGNGPGLSSIGDGTVQVKLLHGWFGGTDAWYSCFATSDIRTAQTENLTLAPKLASAQFGGASQMFVVVNYNNQGPVFERSPLVGPYSGLWLVTYIRWLPGTTPWVICDASAPVGAPPGLPTPDVQAIYSPLPSGVVAQAGHTVLDCPIFAIGPISNPWHKTSSFSPPYCYRIPQGRYVDTYNKLLTIPYWKAYCQDPITRRICVKKIIMPDVGVMFVQQAIGANYAPLLSSLDLANRSDMWVMDWEQTVNGGFLKILANQYPVLSDCPSECSWRNTNYAYSPVFDMFVLLRNLALISPEVLFQTEDCILRAIMDGRLLSSPGIPVNAPVICDNNVPG